VNQGQLDFAKQPEREVVLPPLAFTLRNYQAAAHDNFYAATYGGSPGSLLVQCTGTGKTATGCGIAHTWLEQGHEYRVMIILHERQLFTQWAREVEKIMSITPGLEAGADHHVQLPIPKLVIAMRQSLGERVRGSGEDKDVVSRLWKYPTDNLKWLLMFDEGHRYAMHLKQVAPIIAHFPDAPRLLMTATPERSDKTSLSTMAPTVIADYPHTSLDGRPCAVDDGWVVPFKQFFVTIHSVDLKKVEEKGKDFDEADLANKLSTLKALDSIIKPAMDIVEDRKTLIFCVDCDMSRKLVARMNTKFKPGCAKWIDGSLPVEEREMILKQHQNNEFQFLSVVQLCKEGYDDHEIGAVVCARPTKLASLAEQQRGRACRILKGTDDGCRTKEERVAAIARSKKPYAIVVDMVGVTGLGGNQTCASILAKGLPDRLVDLASERANLLAASDDQLSTREVVEKAVEEIEREEKEAEARREAAKQRLREEKEELYRLRCVEMGVEYVAEELRQGQGHIKEKKKWEMTIKKGPHKGKLLSECPTEWIERCVHAMPEFYAGNRKNWYRYKLKKELDYRRSTPVAKQASDLDDVNRLLQEM